MKRVLFLLIIGVIFASCSEESTINSTITRGGNFLVGEVTEKNNTPISNAKVKLFEERSSVALAKTLHEDAQLNCIDSTISDSLGNYRFELNESGDYVLKIYVGDSLYEISDVKYVADGEQVHNITITFLIPTKEDSIASAVRDSIVRDSIVRDSIVRDSIVRDSIMKVEFDSIIYGITGTVPEFVNSMTLMLVDDFENSASESNSLTKQGDELYGNVDALPAGHNWFFSNYNLYANYELPLLTSAGSFGYPDYMNDTLVEKGFTEKDGNSFYAQRVYLKSGEKNWYAEMFYGVGVWLSERDSFSDFSNVKGIQFYAAGEGELRISLRGDFGDTLQGHTLEYYVELTNEWKLYEFDIASMEPEEYTKWALREYEGWENLRQNVSAIVFDCQGVDYLSNEFAFNDHEVFLAMDNLALSLKDSVATE